MACVTFEEFQAYYQIKACDVLTMGQYRKHMSQCRDSGDLWAVTLYNRHNVVQQKIRELNQLVSELTNPLSWKIQHFCRDVMACAQPPIRLQAGLGTCQITGVSCEHCLDLSKPGKDNKEVLVQNRFWYFFVFLWYCAKLEYIIRSCTKQWMAVNKAKMLTSEYDLECQAFMQSSDGEVRNMHELFCKAYAYVTDSLATHKSKYSIQAVLRPPDEYLMDDVV